ncbi:MAG: hypothetical protein NW203_05530 [Hyphomonadaceae bacterium]|nr:hypothetical protein [Hyphomonadaceae bacterium]
MTSKRSIAAVAALALAACATMQPARMALPASLLGAGETVVVTGVGAGRSGAFQAGDYAGAFMRSAARLAFFDPLYERRDGRNDFTVGGRDLQGQIAASCSMRERTITLSVVSIEPQPMAYVCDFEQEGGRMPGRLELQAHRQGIGGMMMRQERRGEITLDRVVLQIRSAHAVQGSSLQMATPIGYVFERDGVAVGAVEINGAPAITYGADANPETRRAILLASLALGLFWDPAESALGREAG